MPDFRLPLLYDEVLMGRVKLTEADMRSMLRAMRSHAWKLRDAAAKDDADRAFKLGFAADCLLLAEEVLAPRRDEKRAAA